MKIFSGTSNRILAEKITKNLGTDLSPLEVHIFPDGEKRVRVVGSVIDENVAIVQTSSTPVDQNYMELFFAVDALKRSGAKSVTAVVPYLGYQRQDHIFRDGEAVSLEVVIKMLEAGGVDKLLVFDLHSIKIPELFQIPVTHLSALSLFAQEIKAQKWENKDSVLISPDMGGIRRIKLLSDMLDGMAYAAIEKNRDLGTGEVTAEQIEGKLKKRAIIVDDMISSGGTIVVAANLLRSRGVEEIIVFATHPVFSDAAPKLLQDSLVKAVYVTDSIAVSEKKKFPKLHVISVAEMIAKNI